MTDVFILLNQGSVTIDASNFDHLLTLRSLFWISDLCIVNIKNSNFEKIVSLLQESLIFSIQNPYGKITIDNCTIKDTLS